MANCVDTKKNNNINQIRYTVFVCYMMKFEIHTGANTLGLFSALLHFCNIKSLASFTKLNPVFVPCSMIIKYRSHLFHNFKTVSKRVFVSGNSNNEYALKTTSYFNCKLSLTFLLFLLI